ALGEQTGLITGLLPGIMGLGPAPARGGKITKRLVAPATIATDQQDTECEHPEPHPGIRSTIARYALTRSRSGRSARHACQTSRAPETSPDRYRARPNWTLASTQSGRA